MFIVTERMEIEMTPKQIATMKSRLRTLDRKIMGGKKVTRDQVLAAIGMKNKLSSIKRGAKS